MSKSKVEYEESWLCDTCNDKVSMMRGRHCITCRKYIRSSRRFRASVR